MPVPLFAIRFSVVSTNCGLDFDALVYDKSGDELGTRDTSQSNFVPEFEWDWRRVIRFDRFRHLLGEDILLQFQTINRKGNNVYIDNLKVFTKVIPEPAGIEDYSSLIGLFPNPTSGNLFVRAEGRKCAIRYQGI